MAELSPEEIRELKRHISKLEDGARFRGLVLLGLSLAVLPIALTLASTSYSYTQKVGDTSVVVIETKGWIGDLKDIVGLLAPVIVASPILANWLMQRQKRQAIVSPAEPESEPQEEPTIE